MNCTHCGNSLDTQAIQLGACQYCGQAIPKQDTTGQSAATFGTVGYPAAADSASQSVYAWQDWPATNAPPSGPIGGAGQTRPTLPQITPPPGSAPWSGTGTGSANDAPTQPGPRSFAASAPPSPGTLPFGTSAPPAGNIPARGAAAPGAGAPPPQQPAAPHAAFGAPPRYVSTAPARASSGRRLALAGVIVLIAVVLIGGGLLFASSFNHKAPGTSVGASNPTQPTTPKPGTTPAAQPTAQATPTPTTPAAPTPLPTRTYADPGNLYTIQYPTSWTENSYSPPATTLPFTFSGVRFNSGKPEFVILTAQQPVNVPGLAQQVDNAFLSALNAQNISGPRQASIGGQSWTEESADTSGGKHTVIASIVVNSHLYTLWYSAPTGEFSADETQVFTPMLNSFMFRV